MKAKRLTEGYIYSVSKEERQYALNRSINRRVSKRFEGKPSQETFYLTTLFL